MVLAGLGEERLIPMCEQVKGTFQWYSNSQHGECFLVIVTNNCHFCQTKLSMIPQNLGMGIELATF